MSGPFWGLLVPPAAITTLRAAAGIHIPNHAFRDANPALYAGTKVGRDGLVWNLSKYRGWYYVGYNPSDNYGNYPGAKVPAGWLGGSSCYIATAAMTTGQSISTDHKVLASTIFTEQLPFSRFFAAHYDKALSLALPAVVPTDCTIGTNLKAWFSCYNAAGAFIPPTTHNGLTEGNPIELVFTNAGTLGTGSWQRLLAHSAVVMPDDTAYVQLHLGVNSPDGVNTGFIFGDAALMLNPTDGTIAQAGPVYFVDITPQTIRAVPAMQWEAANVVDRRMLDGRLARSVLTKDALKHRFQAHFTKIGPDPYRQLLALWSLSTQGLGLHVPEPVPICVDFGLGQAPFFGYYHVAEAVYPGTFHPHWTLAGGGYDLTLGFVEV
ncbi:hypothetical protein FJ251_08800 [bacterium]|nr:hypothetical protein [bacterium]